MLQINYSLLSLIDINDIDKLSMCSLVPIHMDCHCIVNTEEIYLVGPAQTKYLNLIVIALKVGLTLIKIL